MNTKIELMPSLFIGHGSPMNIILQNSYSDALIELSNYLPKPSCIICVSAHWLTDGTWLTASEQPEQIFDFYGFPQELYSVSYTPPGSPNLVEEITASFPKIKKDYDWGLDHGSWGILKHIYPNEDIPIVQMSIDANLTFEEHFLLARNLRGLRKQGIMFLGSGNLVHNLGLIDFKNMDAEQSPWVEEFDSYILDSILSGKLENIFEIKLIRSLYKLACPTDEHLIPLFYCLGFSYEDEKPNLIYRGFQNRTISMTSLGYGL